MFYLDFFQFELSVIYMFFRFYDMVLDMIKSSQNPADMVLDIEADVKQPHIRVGSTVCVLRHLYILVNCLSDLPNLFSIV